MDKTYELLNVEEMTLEEWLNTVFNPPPGKTFIDYKFPTDKHKDQYINGISERTEEEVNSLILKFLIPSGQLGFDKYNLISLFHMRISNPELFTSLKKKQYYRRLIGYASKMSPSPPWEGITWILDLLPNFPKEALEGLSSYFLAHCQLFPDGRFEGMIDAEALIRAKYIGAPVMQADKIGALLSVDSYDFEHIVERLFSKMGYDTRLTRKSKDGGYDILATTRSLGRSETLVIECKKYTKPVGVVILRGLLGIVESNRVTRGVLVTTGQFTKDARNLANNNTNIEIISGSELTILLNEFLGYHWPLQMSSIVQESKRESVTNKLK